jgi:transposase
MIATKIEPALKRIEDLSLRELDMVYSLSRIGRSYPDIGKRYRISESDVRKIVNDYVQLRKLCEARPTDERKHANAELQLTAKKPRKRRCDAIYATTKERQAAYRARLQERRRAGVQFPSPAPITDSSTPVEEEVSVTTVVIS